MFVTVITSLIVTVAATVLFFILDSIAPTTTYNSGPAPTLFNISELNLALNKPNYRLPLDEGYEFSYKWDSNYLFMEDGYVCPFKVGSTLINITAKRDKDTFHHSLPIYIHDITAPEFSVETNEDNSFSLTISSCPAAQVGTITTTPAFETIETNRQNYSLVYKFKTNSLSEDFTCFYDIKLDNFSIKYSKALTATQVYEAEITHTTLSIIDESKVDKANEDGVYSSAEFILTKDYNLKNFSSVLRVQNPAIVSIDGNKITPKAAGKTRVYVAMGDEIFFEREITVNAVEVQEVSVSEHQTVGKPFSLTISPCYALNNISYSTHYLSYEDEKFLPLVTGTTTITVLSGTKVFKKEITISFSQSEVKKIIESNKNVVKLDTVQNVNEWFSLKLFNEPRIIQSESRQVIFIDTENYEMDYTTAPNYKFKFSQTGLYYIVAMNNTSVVTLYEVMISK